MPQGSGRRPRQEAWSSLVSLLVRPRFGAGLLHRIVCDGRKMGFRGLRDNQALRHRIVAEIAGNTVTAVIDTPVACLDLIGPFPFRLLLSARQVEKCRP